jgi:cell division protein FtsQ
MGMVAARHNAGRCKNVVISIDHNGEDAFITETEIRSYIHLVSDSLEGEQLGKIDIHKLELLIAANPYVLKTSVYSTLDGIIHIDVNQRKPIVRVQNAAMEQWYISEDGHLMPLNPGRSARVPLASGYLTEFYSPELVLHDGPIITRKDTLMAATKTYGIYKIALQISKDPFLQAQIEQIYLNKEGDFELLPMVGKQLIIFGDAGNAEKKFANLEIFYKEGLSKEGWDTYDTVNLKFENQVVCTIK